MKIKYFTSLVYIFVTIFILGSLFFLFNRRNNKDELKIGVIAPLTGAQARNAQAMQRGFDLVSEEDGIFLKYEDSQNDAIKAKNAAFKLIKVDKVNAILGDSRSAITKVIADETDRENIILFSSISTSDVLCENILFFRNVPRNTLQAKSAYVFIKNNLGFDNVAIFNKNDDYGNDMANNFKKNAADLNIVFSEAYANGRSDFRTSLEKIKNSGAEIIFTPSNYEETQNLIKQSIEIGLNIPIIGGDDTNDDLINIARQYKGCYYYTSFMIEQNSDYYKSFYEKFKNKYNIEPQTYDAYAYEAAKILSEAVRLTSGKTDDIKTYLTQNEFNSLTGKITFSENGEIENRMFGIIKVDSIGSHNIKIE